MARHLSSALLSNAPEFSRLSGAFRLCRSLWKASGLPLSFYSFEALPPRGGAALPLKRRCGKAKLFRKDSGKAARAGR